MSTSANTFIFIASIVFLAGLASFIIYDTHGNLLVAIAAIVSAFSLVFVVALGIGRK